MIPARLIISCEHARNRIPARFAEAFRGAGRALAGHAGWDRGALEMARLLARRSGAPMFTGRFSRLLIDLNRSPGHAQLFSQWSARLDERARASARRYYDNFREVVTDAVAQQIRRGPVLHLSVHSFAPRLDGRTRDADVGLLFDPQRDAERRLALHWQRNLRRTAPQLRVRRNYPYRGVDDGLVQTLRGRWTDPRYIGFELEINQRCTYRADAWRALRRLLCTTLLEAERRP